MSFYDKRLSQINIKEPIAFYKFQLSMIFTKINNKPWIRLFKRNSLMSVCNKRICKDFYYKQILKVNGNLQALTDYDLY